MIVLDVKLERHGKVPVLVANAGLRGYNVGTILATQGKMVYNTEEIDVRRIDFKFPTMVDRRTAMEAYIFS